MNDINDDEPLTDRDEDLRSQNSRIPRQKMRAILVRTPANKDEPISSRIEDDFNREPHEPDVLITELKGNSSQVNGYTFRRSNFTWHFCLPFQFGQHLPERVNSGLTP